MTKEDWGKVENALRGACGYAKLRVDGREVMFMRQLLTGNRMGIITYVDGEWQGKWISGKNECPEQRYLRPASRFIFRAKFRAEFKRWPKKLQKLHAVDIDEKVRYFDLNWPNVTAIRRHYQKTFTSIELIEVVG